MRRRRNHEWVVGWAEVWADGWGEGEGEYGFSSLLKQKIKATNKKNCFVIYSD